MTRQHLAESYFDGKTEACKKRIQKLLSSNMISERSRRPNEPAVLFLARRGFDTLSDAGMLSNYPQRDWRSFQKRVNVSEVTIRHELEVMDVKAAFNKATRGQSDLSLAEFSTWPKLYEFQARRPVTRDGWTHDREVLMKPDGFIRIQEHSSDGITEYCYFLEVDRGTETLTTVASKALGYRDYYRQGGFAKWMGGDPANPAACPFRVIAVFNSAERRDNVVSQLHQQIQPIRGLVWATTRKDILNDPLEMITGEEDTTKE